MGKLRKEEFRTRVREEEKKKYGLSCVHIAVFPPLENNLID